MPNLFSYPSTLAAAQDTKSRQIKVLQNNVQLNLDQAPRAFKTGDVVSLSDHEYAGISASAFTGGYVVDRGQFYSPGDDASVRVIEIPMNLAAIADGTVTGFKVPFAGEIKKVEFIDLDPATTGSKGSTLNLKLGTRPLGTNEVVTLTVGGSGLTSFTLTFGGQTTTSILAAAVGADVQAALEALSTVGAGNVTVTGGSGGVWTVTFVGALGGTNVGNITTTPTGGTGTVTPNVGTAGLTTVLTLTTSALDTEGKVVASTNAFTSGNATFAANTEIAVVAASTTAFVEGRGMVRIVVAAA